MSSEPVVVSARDLGKAYDIGAAATESSSLREALVRRLRHPFRALDSERFWALQDVSFDVRRGEVVGLIGRNGAGKSTLLKLLSRITNPTTGAVDLWGRTGSLLEVGTGFHRELTGRENIFLNGAILGMKRNEIAAKFDEIVDFAGTEKFLDTPVKRYSSGMYVRLAFSVAAHLDTEILLVDEVLSVGDVEFQKKCLGKMDEVADSGRTILFVSHKMGTIRDLTQRTIYLKDGTIRADGPTGEIVDLYVHDSLGAAQGATDLSYFRRDVNPDSPVRIEAIRVSGPDHQGRAHVREPLCVEIRLHSKAEVRDASVSVGLKTEEGEVVAFLLTRDRDFPVDLDPGSTTLRCHLGDLHLAPGRYLVNVGINRQVGVHAWDAILDYPAVEIANAGPEALVHRPDRPGQVLVPHPRWESNR